MACRGIARFLRRRGGRAFDRPTPTTDHLGCWYVGEVRRTITTPGRETAAIDNTTARDLFIVVDTAQLPDPGAPFTISWSVQ